MSSVGIYLWWKGYTNTVDAACANSHNTGTNQDLTTLQESGFDTAILWTLHVKSQDGGGFKKGDIVYNDCVVVSQGKYCGDPGWSDYVSNLKKTGSSINSVLISVGSADNTDFANIGSLGFDTNGLLYEGFAALLAAIPALDGVVFDYEEFSTEAQKAVVPFALMLQTIGYGQIAFCPYMSQPMWDNWYTEINKSAPGLVVESQLQCYSGGGGNQNASILADWTKNPAGGASFIHPGLACTNSYAPGNLTPQGIINLYKTWTDASVTGLGGGWIWHYDYIVQTSSPTVAEYASAVSSGLAGNG